MKLTAPLHVLKGKAKTLKRSEAITMSEALNRVANEEGFASWGLLTTKARAYVPDTVEDLFDWLYPGDMLLIGARPGIGKTKLMLQLLLRAITQGRTGFFFSLEYTEDSFSRKMAELNKGLQYNQTLLTLNFSDDISAQHIIKTSEATIKEGSIVAVDYLQLLDQKRNKPPLQMQVEDLRDYARHKKCIFVFSSQIDRAFELSKQIKPTLADVRLPNPLDLGLFNKSVFIHERQLSA